jgi:hypothetical protein
VFVVVGLILGIVTASAAPAQQLVGQDVVSVPQLFASHEPLDLTLEADFRALDRDRDDEREQHPARLSYRVADGAAVTIDVQLRTRGNFRLSRSTCEFPPLRLNFRKRDVGETLFAGQDKLKLVAHCENGREDNEQYVLREYLIYRMYGLFTEMSFRVRLARITYVWTGEESDTLTKYGFFIEDEEQMAQRNGGEILDSAGVHGFEADDEQATLFEVFQYFVGNTDWSVSALHNVKLILRQGDPFPVLVPYDFDWSGIVDARYAVPPPALPTYSVTERFFIGPCRPEYDVRRVVALFNERRAEITDLIRNQPGLADRSQRKALEYIDDFYECVNDERCMRRELIRRCPG